MRCRRLRELRCPLVEREHVWITVLVHCTDMTRLLGVIPGASRELYDARPDRVGNMRAG